MTTIKQNKQKKLYQDILFVLISSFIVVIAWIGSNLYHIYITSTISEEVQAQLPPIEGTFDVNTLHKLKSRIQVNPAFEIQQTTSQSAAPTRVPESVIAEEQASSSSRFAPTNTPISRLGQ